MADELREQLQSSLGGYAIQRELPGGGMSRVFLAEERALARRVVIKLLPPELAGAVSIERFKREIALAARLQHAHIVPLHSAGELNGLPFYIMPYVEGDSLRARLARGEEQPIGDVVRMLREIASALAYAHQRGVVHRDIKPDNILLSGDAAMVTDFGVAKALEVSSVGLRRLRADERDIAGLGNPGITATEHGWALGTPAYMAPEQVVPEGVVDHRADLYAFGVLAYEVLTGQPPFAGKTPAALIVAHVSVLPEPVTSRRRGIPGPLAELVMRCLEKEPAQRPRDAGEIVHLLDDINAAWATTAASGSERALGAVASAWRRRLIPVIATAVLAVSVGVFLWRRPQEAPMLAILPFENLGEPADAYFADGLTEEISSRLANVSGLRIIGRTSSQQYKRSTRSMREIGLDLGVNFLLVGTVYWEREPGGGKRVRVSPHLIRTADQTSAWSKSWEGEFSDMLGFQTTIAEGVADAMNVALPAREQIALKARVTANPDAYDAYLRGLASSMRGRLFDPEARATAIGEFQRAVDLDPSFASAHARLALAHVFAERFGNDRRALDAAAPHLESAISLDSSSIDTRYAQSWYLLERNRLEEAHSAVHALIRAAPTNSQALYLDGLVEEARDHPEEAIASLKGAEALERTSPDPPAALASLYDAVGRHKDAIRAREHEIALSPDNGAAYFAQAASYLLWSYDTASARRMLTRGVASAGLGRMVRLPSSWVLDWVPLLPPALAATIDTLTREGSAATLPGPSFDAVKLRFHAGAGHAERVRAIADSIILRLGPGRLEGDPETRLLLAAAMVSVGRLSEAQRHSDAAFAQLSMISAPRLRIPGVVMSAWIAMASGNSDVAIGRLESVTNGRSGFYVSGVLLRVDSLWEPLRRHQRFAQVAASAR